MNKFTLLRKQSYRPRPYLFPVYTPEEILERLSSIPEEETVHIDIETTGLDPLQDSIVCIGIASSQGHFCTDTREPEMLSIIIRWLGTRKGGYGAFNSIFDGAFLTVALIAEFPGGKTYKYLEKIKSDSYVSFKILANEDKSSRSLEVAIEHILGWPEKDFQKTWLKDALTRHELSKNNMSELLELEHREFLRYCSLDAEASFQLESYLNDFMEYAKFPETKKIRDLYVLDIRLQIEAFINGILIDRDKAIEYKKFLEDAIATSYNEILKDPDIGPRIALYNKTIQEAHEASLVKTKKFWAKKSDQPWKHPNIWTKGFKNTMATWEKEHGAWFRIEESIKETTKQPQLFNPGSDSDLIWLFYGKARNCTGQTDIDPLVPYKVLRYPDPESNKPWERSGLMEFSVPNGHTLEWETTSSGEFPVDQDLRNTFGRFGKLLNEWKSYTTRLERVEKLLKASEKNGRVHALKRPMATVTARSGSSGDVGIVTLTKTSGYMRSFIADPGYKIIQADAASLEDVILAELSRDPLMMEVYASGKPHDGYLYFAAKYDVQSNEISRIYNPDNPTKESVKEAKGKFKRVRKTWKVIKLSKNYSAGAKKIQRNMAAKEDIWLSLEEVQETLASYDKAVEGVTRWKESLEHEWRCNGGWIRNALGRPMSVPETYLKDLASRKIQSSGRDCLAIFLAFIHHLRIKYEVNMIPWLPDYHDETMWICPEYEVERAEAVFKEAANKLNEVLQWKAKLKFEPEIGTKLTDFKECTDDIGENNQ